MKRAGIISLVLVAAWAPAVAAPAPVDVVDPFMGTIGDRGQLSPAAAAPFGMVQLAPDTTPANHIGYDREATTLKGFSQTRAQGVGCHGGGGDLLASVTYLDEIGPPTIDHRSERAGPGWYRVRYGTKPISAKLAAASRYRSVVSPCPEQAPLRSRSTLRTATLGTLPMNGCHRIRAT